MYDLFCTISFIWTLCDKVMVPMCFTLNAEDYQYLDFAKNASLWWSGQISSFQYNNVVVYRPVVSINIRMHVCQYILWVVNHAYANIVRVILQALCWACMMDCLSLSHAVTSIFVLCPRTLYFIVITIFFDETGPPSSGLKRYNNMNNKTNRVAARLQMFTLSNLLATLAS